MPYNYNPHRHVKIWLTKDKDTFLNLENQIRLVQMRHINPLDQINFVFDKSLLSEKAFLELQSFCSKYNIIPKDLRQDIFPYCDHQNELNLIEIYEDEISHLEEGGNLGVASDLIRWLKPIFSLGTYADFDVNINTSALPEMISVAKPFLLNLGSFNFTADVECTTVNNDIIAVVDPESALSDIQRIQQYIYRCCSRQSTTEDNFLEEFKTHFITTLSQFIGSRQAQLVFNQDVNLQTLPIIANFIRGKTVREVRHIILKMTENNLMYSRQTLMHFNEPQDGLSDEAIISRAVTLLREDPCNAHKDIQDDNLFITLTRQSTRMAFLKNTVIYTSGPNALLLTFFRKVFHKEATVNEEIRPFSFSCYGLDSAFVSQNGFAFHENVATVTAKYCDTEIGKFNDLSWLEEGQDATKKREQKIKEAQLKILQIFHEIREAIEDHIQEIQEEIDCFLGFYRYRAKIAQINTLQSIMKHFEDDGFDVYSFNQAFQDSDSADSVANLGQTRTKIFIEELRFFAKESMSLMLTDEHGKVKIPSQRSLASV